MDDRDDAGNENEKLPSRHKRAVRSLFRGASNDAAWRTADGADNRQDGGAISLPGHKNGICKRRALRQPPKTPKSRRATETKAEFTQR